MVDTAQYGQERERRKKRFFDALIGGASALAPPVYLASKAIPWMINNPPTIHNMNDPISRQQAEIRARRAGYSDDPRMYRAGGRSEAFGAPTGARSFDQMAEMFKQAVAKIPPIYGPPMPAPKQYGPPMPDRSNRTVPVNVTPEALMNTINQRTTTAAPAERGGGVPDTAPAQYTGAATTGETTTGTTTERIPTRMPTQWAGEETQYQPRKTRRETYEGSVPYVSDTAEYDATQGRKRVTGWDTDLQYAAVSQMDKSDYAELNKQTTAEGLVDMGLDFVLTAMEKRGTTITPEMEQELRARAVPAMQQWYADQQETPTNRVGSSTQLTDFMVALTTLVNVVNEPQTTGSTSDATTEHQRAIDMMKDWARQGGFKVDSTLTPGSIPAPNSYPNSVTTANPTPGTATATSNPGREGKHIKPDDKNFPTREEGVTSLGTDFAYDTYVQWAIVQPENIDNTIDGFLFAHGVGG